MKLTDLPVENYERVVRCDDPDNGLKAFIVIHNTVLGPALGGIRMWPYPSETEAVTDGLRLAQGMTYKSAVADTGFGGGKAVVIGHPKTDKSASLLRAMGRFIHALDGVYIAAEDVGLTEDDMLVIGEETPHVAGLPRACVAGDNPARLTAFGVFLGIRVCLERALHTDRFSGVRVAVQGCGNVASYLCQHLSEAGAVLTVADVDRERARNLAQSCAASVVDPEAIYQVDCDVFAPCALGGVVNDVSVPQLTGAIVAGSANNQCLGPEHEQQLHDRGILYAPDFVINAGGIINIAVEREPEGYDEARALTRVRHIAMVLHDIFDLAEHEQRTTAWAARQLAERKLMAGQHAVEKG